MKIKRTRLPRQTVYVVINGIKASTTDMQRLWSDYIKGKLRFTMKVDEDGDIIIETKD